jgi:hypothetical protein
LVRAQINYSPGWGKRNGNGEVAPEAASTRRRVHFSSNLAFTPSFFQHGKPKFLVFNFFDLIVNVGREIKKLP